MGAEKHPVPARPDRHGYARPGCVRAWLARNSQGGHFAAQWREELGNCLHRLDGAEHVVLGELRADCRQLDIYHIPELALCVIRDAYLDGAVGRGADVLVLFCVFEVGGDVSQGALREAVRSGSLPGRCEKCQGMLHAT